MLGVQIEEVGFTKWFVNLDAVAGYHTDGDGLRLYGNGEYVVDVDGGSLPKVMRALGQSNAFTGDTRSGNRNGETANEPLAYSPSRHGYTIVWSDGRRERVERTEAESRFDIKDHSHATA